MVTIERPERIDYYDHDKYLFGRCDCDVPLLYRIPIKKMYKPTHVYKYKCVDCGYEGAIRDCNYDCLRCELTIDECIHSHRI